MNDLPLPDIQPDRLQQATNEIEFTPAPATVTDSAGHEVTEAEVAVAVELVSTVSQPISAVMEATLWTVHAEDFIEAVEATFAAQGLNSAPVVGSNGAIVGMIGAPELAAFHAEGKNPRAVQAWEISRIKYFEVSPTDTVEEVAKLMNEHRIDTISVTEFGRLKGIVSAQNLLQEILNVLPGETDPA